MSKALNIQKKREVEYAHSGWFSHGMEHLHALLDTLNVDYTTRDEWASEYDDEFEIDKKSFSSAIEKLHQIDNGNDPDDVDVFDLTDRLDDAGMSLQDLIECFEWVAKNAAPNHEWIYVCFF